ncbi:MAG: macro domain-containing protein [Chloroflexi bacterium]|nr:macro domain-containing protein [Chloroflexota bacterium]
MSNVTEITGNIFTSECQTLVNTVNCVGVMGAGIALEFKFRHPTMFERYVQLCKVGHIETGKLWLYKPPKGDSDRRWVLNFPTKKHWKDPSKNEYLVMGLKKFLETYKDKSVESIAFPILGATNGKIAERESLSIMQNYLAQCDIPVEIYHYDPTATDDLYQEFRRRILANEDDKSMAKDMGLRINFVRKIREVLEWEDAINSLSQLASVKGIGLKTLEKSFRYVMDNPEQVGTKSML